MSEIVAKADNDGDKKADVKDITAGCGPGNDLFLQHNSKSTFFGPLHSFISVLSFLRLISLLSEQVSFYKHKF